MPGKQPISNDEVDHSWHLLQSADLVGPLKAGMPHCTSKNTRPLCPSSPSYIPSLLSALPMPCTPGVSSNANCPLFEERFDSGFYL